MHSIISARGGLGVNKPPLNGHLARPRSEDKPRTQGRRGTGVRPRRRGLGTGGACADAHAFLRGISLNQAHVRCPSQNDGAPTQWEHRHSETQWRTSCIAPGESMPVIFNLDHMRGDAQIYSRVRTLKHVRAVALETEV